MQQTLTGFKGYSASYLLAVAHAAAVRQRVRSLTGNASAGTRRNPAIVLWLLVLAAVPIVLSLGPFGWDAAVYRNAIRSLQAGHDPYLVVIAAQVAHRSQIPQPDGNPPRGFVYSPIILPLLRVMGGMPAQLGGVLYWSFYVACAFATIRVLALTFEESEWRVLLCLAPITAFFPGLLANGSVLGGNIAYILYGLTFSAAAYGWRSNRWLWFYLSVVAAACVKAPLLSLVVIPVLTCRRQWIQAVITFSAGLALFGMTAVLWPTLFKHYLEAVDHQFLLYHDFGCSPAGIFSTYLEGRGIPYISGASLFWGIYVAPLLGTLLVLSRRDLNGAFSLRQWLPVMLSGVMLLNPRLIEYDLFPITLPLLILAWRFTRTYIRPRQAVVFLALVLATANAIAAVNWTTWKFVGGLILVTYFLSSCWILFTLQPQIRRASSPRGTRWSQLIARTDFLSAYEKAF